MKIKPFWTSSLVATALIGLGVSGTGSKACEVVYPQDERELIQQASLIVVGTPTGPVEETPGVTGSPNDSTYVQMVQVQEILKQKGEKSLRTVSVGISGISTTSQTGVKSSCDDVPNRLRPGKQILFLQPGYDRSNLFIVVGLTAGALELDKTGHIKSSDRFKAFKDLDVPAVRQKINELSIPTVLSK